MEKLLFSDNVPVFVCDFPKCNRSYTSEYSFQEHQKLRAHLPGAKTADEVKPASGGSAEKPKEDKNVVMSDVAPASLPPVVAPESVDPAPPRRLLNLAIRSGRPEPAKAGGGVGGGSGVDQSQSTKNSTAKPGDTNGTRHAYS